MSELMNVYQRINEVRKEVKYVRKDAQAQGYKAVSHDMVTAVLRDSMVKNGLVVRVTENQRSSAKVADTGAKTQSGVPIIRFEASYVVTLVNVDDPKDVVTQVLTVHANDFGDKAPGKAISYATKYALLKIFSLETGENEESRVQDARDHEKLLEYARDKVEVFAEHDDALSVFLLMKKIGADATTELFNFAPAGQKSKWKAKLRDLETRGGELLIDINKAIKSEQPGAALEAMELLTGEGKSLLAEYLGAERSKFLGEMISSIQT